MKNNICDRCKQDFAVGIPAPGKYRVWGNVTYNTWLIRFNYIRMKTWEKAITSADTIDSAVYSEVHLCSVCWGDVLSFINKTTNREK